MKKTLLFTVSILLGLMFLTYPEITKGKVNGSPGGGKTNSPGDGQNCTACHDDFALNSGVGTTTITSNIPSTGYVPGVTYTITSSIAEVGLVRFGFELTAEDNSNNKTGTFFITNSTETKLKNNNTAVTHRSAGTTGINSKQWSFDWEAPVAGTGLVTFYSACNAANDDGDDDVDQIYTSSLSVSEFIPLPSWNCINGTTCIDPGTGGGQYNITTQNMNPKCYMIHYYLILT